MSVILAGKTIGEVFELLQKLKSVKAVAEEIGVTPGAVYAFRSKNHKSFKKLKDEAEGKEPIEVNDKKVDSEIIKETKILSTKVEPVITENKEEQIKNTILEKENKSLDKKIKQLTSEKNQLHGRITLLNDEIQSFDDEKNELNIEIQRLTEENEKLRNEKHNYEEQLDELTTASEAILAEAKKYREVNKEYQNKIALLSERATDVSEDELLKIKKELAFYKDHAFMYYEKANEVS